MSKHIAFPDIGQYRNLIRNVAQRAQYVGKDENGDPRYDPARPLPTLEFVGTVKLHGTNAAIACAHEPEGEVLGEKCEKWTYWFQSRERLLSLESDNAGFVRHFNDKPYHDLFKNLPPGKTTVIYGEWCGSGIQKGVGISALPKMFVVFAIRSGDEWLPRDVVAKVKAPEMSVYNIFDYDHRFITIDFTRPIDFQNQLGELTLAVENACPVAKAFGKEGVGEGIVWTCITPGWEDSKFWMKVKGEKHSVSKVKTLAAVDMEVVKSQQEFVANTVTEARCLQSISKLKEAGKPLDRTSLGEFIRWIYNDIIKEESDTAKANGIDLEKMGGPIAQASKSWFFKNEASLPL